MLVKPVRPPFRFMLPGIDLEEGSGTGADDDRLLLPALPPLPPSDQLGSSTELLEHDDELGSSSGVGGEGWRACCLGMVTALRRPDGPCDARFS